MIKYEDLKSYDDLHPCQQATVRAFISYTKDRITKFEYKLKNCTDTDTDREQLAHEILAYKDFALKYAHAHSHALYNSCKEVRDTLNELRKFVRKFAKDLNNYDERPVL